MKYSALLFDMDGTIVHNVPYHDEAMLETLIEEGAPIPADRPAFFRNMSGKRNTEIFRGIFGEDITDQELARLEERKETRYRELFAAHQRAVPGLVALLGQARALGLATGLATSAPPLNIDFTIDALGIRPLFDVIVGGTDVRNGKPDPEIFLAAAARLGVSPGACLVFEDTLNGLLAAQRAGMDAVLVCTTLNPDYTAGFSHIRQVVADFSEIDLAKLAL